jgi:hypothetical protein
VRKEGSRSLDHLVFREIQMSFTDVAAETVIRRVMKQFSIGARKRGPKPGK